MIDIDIFHQFSMTGGTPCLTLTLEKNST